MKFKINNDITEEIQRLTHNAEQIMSEPILMRINSNGAYTKILNAKKFAQELLQASGILGTDHKVELFQNSVKQIADNYSSIINDAQYRTMLSYIDLTIFLVDMAMKRGETLGAFIKFKKQYEFMHPGREEKLGNSISNLYDLILESAQNIYNDVEEIRVK